MKKVLIFGVGNYYLNKKDTIHQSYEVVGFVDNKKAEKEFENMPIISATEIRNKEYDFIIIASSFFIDIFKQLIELGIKGNKILFGQNLPPYNAFEKGLCGEYGEIQIDDQSHIFYKRKERGNVETSDIIFYFNTRNELENLKNIYFEKEYNLVFSNGNQNIIFDIGMNIGAASLYFANLKSVCKVYGVEPFKDTFDVANKNVLSNVKIKDKIELFNYGLDNYNGKSSVTYNPEMSCGMSTNKIHNKLSILQYDEWIGLNKEKSYLTEVDIVNAADFIKEKIEDGKNIIIKMDCEGSEYNIMNLLNQKKLIRRINAFIIEWHDFGAEKLEKILQENKFTYLSMEGKDDKGMIYAINLDKRSTR